MYLPGYWKPEIGEIYHAIVGQSIVKLSRVEGNYDLIKSFVLHGTIFKTEPEAEHHLEYLKAYKKYVTTITRLHDKIDYKVDIIHTHNQSLKVFMVDTYLNQLYSSGRVNCCGQLEMEHFHSSIKQELIQKLGIDLIVLAVTGRKFKGVKLTKNAAYLVNS